METKFICKIEVTRYLKDDGGNTSGHVTSVKCHVHNDFFKALEEAKEEFEAHDVHYITFNTYNDLDVDIYNDGAGDEYFIVAKITKATTIT